MSLHRILIAVASIAFIWGPTACMVKPIPLSAQAGSTITLPLPVQQSTMPAAHGGTDYADPQRGEYVFALGNTVENGGLELTTRFTIALATDDRAVTRGTQYIAVIDLVNPGGTPLPLGTQTLYVSLRRNGQITPLPSVLTWDIAILPAEVDAGGENVTGTATPTEIFAWWQNPPFWGPVPLVTSPTEPEALENVISRPGIGVFVKTNIGAVKALSSFVADVHFPDDMIQVVGTTGRVTWYEDLGVDAGIRTIRVSAAADERNVGTTFLVFDLLGATPLEVTDVTVDVVKATDTNMVPIAAPNYGVVIR